MIESATGIILRSHPFTETSRIVRWLTVGAGRVTTLAKGAQRANSAFAGKLDLLVQADFTFSRSRQSDLHTLREVDVTDFHLPLREDVRRLAAAAYATRLIEKATEPETPLPGCFELFSGFLDRIVVSDLRPRLIFAFELKLLDTLGLFPSMDDSRLKPATRDLVAALGRGNWRDIGGLTPDARTVLDLASFLNGFLAEHLGGVPKGRGELLKAG